MGNPMGNDLEKMNPMQFITTCGKKKSKKKKKEQKKKGNFYYDQEEEDFDYSSKIGIESKWSINYSTRSLYIAWFDACLFATFNYALLPLGVHTTP